ncbi:MAG: hypothetical protein ABSG42_07995 [Nitrospirota bacterium]
MEWDKRKNGGEPMFISDYNEGSDLPRNEIEIDDEVVLYYKGDQVMAIIKAKKGGEFVGSVIMYSYDDKLHPELFDGKEISFSKENIFSVHKKQKL